MDKEFFINEIVFGWMKKDLENISKIRLLTPGAGGANFPLAMCIVVYMDHLGSYLLGTEKGGLEINIQKFLECFKNPSDYSPELLNDLFRNGLAHDYFSRGAISREGIRPPMMNIAGSGVVLDADSLLIDFFEALNSFKMNLTEENFNRRFNEARETMETRYEAHMEIINKLPQPSVVVTAYPQVNSSGVSGTAIYSKDIDELSEV